MRILFTNNALDVRGGSELVILDLAKEFHRRGHMPIVYSRKLGIVAKALRDACIPVISDLNLMGSKPDIIHGQHHVETMSAMLHFSDVPAIYVCHGWLPWQESPPIFSNIQKYVAVGRQTRESIVTSCGIPSEEVEIINNFVDMKKFQIKTYFPDKPQSALIFNNSVAPNSGYAECVRNACNRYGIKKLDIIGAASGNGIDDVHKKLKNYDLVFAVGRSALEAMSVGCSVIAASPFGAKGLITSKNVDSNFMNLGIASLQDELLNPSFLYSEIIKYNPDDSIKVAFWIREKADLSVAANRYELIYENAMHRWNMTPPNHNYDKKIMREASRYLENLKPILNQDQLKNEILSRKSLIQKLKNMGIISKNAAH